MSHKLLNPMDRECSPCASDCPECAASPERPTRIRRNVEKQEATVAALHALIRDNDDARKRGDVFTSVSDARGECTFGDGAIRLALTRIMETFGYVVTEIQ